MSSPAHTPTPTPRARPDASMTLLTEMMERPLDPGYAAAADRREAAGLPRSTGMRGVTIGVTAVLLGFLLVAAALTLRPAGTTASRDKAQLIEQFQARQSHGDAQVAQVNQLGAQVRGYQDAALGTSSSALTVELGRLGLLTGELAAGGPGLLVTVDDAPAAARGDGAVDPRASEGFMPGRVTSRDLQVVTNGLWQAGAEAMSVNGQRLTARSAIRFAGEAILVDYRPLSPPYVITVVGDPQGLQTRFAQTSAGSYLKSLGDNLKIPSTIAAQDRVEVPRASTLTVTFAGSGSTGIPSAAATSASAVPSPPATPLPTSETTP